MPSFRSRFKTSTAAVFPHKYLLPPNTLCQFLDASSLAQCGVRPSRSHAGRQCSLVIEDLQTFLCSGQWAF